MSYIIESNYRIHFFIRTSWGIWYDLDSTICVRHRRLAYKNTIKKQTKNWVDDFYYRYMLRFQITLEFSFKQSAGWWSAVGVEVKRGLATSGLNLQAPAPPDAPSAVLGKAYHCSLPLVYASEEASPTFPNIQVPGIMFRLLYRFKGIIHPYCNIIC